MKKLFLLLSLIVVSFLASGCNQGNPVRADGRIYFRQEGRAYFRDTAWGMSQGSVIYLEGQQPSFQDSWTLRFNSVFVYNLSARATYTFGDDIGLYRAIYTITDAQDSPGQSLMNHRSLRAALIELYGEPTTSEQVESENSMAIGNRSLEGMAIAAGQLSLSDIWELNDTVINLQIRQSSSGNRAEVSIAYWDTGLLMTALEGMLSDIEGQQRRNASGL